MHELRPISTHYQVVHSTTYHYAEPVSLCHSQTHLVPRDTARQSCLSNKLTIHPPAATMDESIDYFGNHVSFFAVQERHDELSVTATSHIRLLSAAYLPPEIGPTWSSVRDLAKAAADAESLDASQFIYDSPLVAASDALADYAAASLAPGRGWLEAVLDLTARINREFVYDPSATSVSTPLATVMETRRGVCQDFAHLQIGCLRSMGLPARYVSGYLLNSPLPGEPRLVGADASHAWLAAWCPGLGWIEFDPTNNLVPSLEHVTIGWGRDYSDVCPIKGVFVGGGEHTIKVSVDVRPVAES